MRAYLPLSHSQLELFVAKKSYEADKAFAPSIHYLVENNDFDEEEVEFTLSIVAAAEALLLRSSDSSPGIVIAVDLHPEQINQHLENQVTLSAPLEWDQVQCALLATGEDDELTWFATQEIAFNIQDWK